MGENCLRDSLPSFKYKNGNAMWEDSNLVCSMRPFGGHICMLQTQIVLPCTICVSLLHDHTNGIKLLSFNVSISIFLGRQKRESSSKEIPQIQHHPPENGLPQYPHLVDTLDDRVTEMQISTAYTHTHTHTHGPAWRPVTNFKLLCFNKKQQSLPC